MNALARATSPAQEDTFAFLWGCSDPDRPGLLIGYGALQPDPAVRHALVRRSENWLQAEQID